MFRFYVTKHAVEQYNERFGVSLDHWGILNILNKSTHDKSIFNNTVFMSYLYEKYGYDTKYVFMVNDKCIFVGIDNGARVSIVTSIDCTDDTHNSGYRHKQKKTFKKKDREPNIRSHRKLSKQLAFTRQSQHIDDLLK